MYFFDKEGCCRITEKLKRPAKAYWIAKAPFHFILDTAVQDDKVMQGFDLESFLMRGGGDHSQKVKRPPSEAIMAQKIAAIYRLQLPFLGLSRKLLFTLQPIQQVSEKSERGLSHSKRFAISQP
jgi:hypothetical protein